MNWISGNPERHSLNLDEPLQKFVDADLKLNGRFLNRLGELEDLESLRHFSGDWDWNPRISASRELEVSVSADCHFFA